MVEMNTMEQVQKCKEATEKFAKNITEQLVATKKAVTKLENVLEMLIKLENEYDVIEGAVEAEERLASDDLCNKGCIELNKKLSDKATDEKGRASKRAEELLIMITAEMLTIGL
jgi:hypothetical protein